jgi:hypothetical protein
MLDFRLQLQAGDAGEDGKIVDPIADDVEPDDADDSDRQREEHGQAAEKKHTLPDRDRLEEPAEPSDRNEPSGNFWKMHFPRASMNAEWSSDFAGINRRPTTLALARQPSLSRVRTAAGDYR